MKVEIAASPMSEKEQKNAPPDKYEIEEGARHLMRAEEIKKDKRLMPHVIKHLAKQKKAISSIEELRSAAKEKLDQSEPDEDDMA